jgi:hypothetical protein
VRRPPMSVDQARIRPHLRYLCDRPLPLRLEHLADQLPKGIAPAQPPSRVFKPEPGDLRGIPIVGRKVGGVQPGTHPLGALLAKERRRR